LNRSTEPAEDKWFYPWVINKYGSITVWWADSAALAKAGLGEATGAQEDSVLAAYYWEFLDHPPKNKRFKECTNPPSTH
jgi:hypothetical protein